MENINENIILINDEFWWHKENINEYEYQLSVNTEFINKTVPHLNGKDVAIQAGGSCGWVVKQMYPHFNHIYTFEPNYISFLCLNLNLPYENVSKFQACLGNERQMVNMSNLYEHLTSSGFVHGKGQIPTLLIDDLNVSACNFIQLDLEGYEYFALLGGRKTIEKFKPLLCIECCWQHRFGVTIETMEDLIIKEWGYKMVDNLNDDRIYKHG